MFGLFTLALFVLSASHKAFSTLYDPESNGCTFTYTVRLANGTKLTSVTNGKTAGVKGVKITDIAIKVNTGSVRYRVRPINGSWLPFVTGYSWNDDNNGYAGNHKAIDLVEVIGSKCAAKYRVSPVNKNFYDYQIDGNTGSGMDGYAGASGKAIDRFELTSGGAKTDPDITNGSTYDGSPCVIKQSSSSYEGVRISGCLFCCACWMANLKSISEFDTAFSWAVGQGLVRKSDAYVQTTASNLASKIAAHYGKSLKSSSLVIQYSGRHYYITTSSGVEVFNSVYIGYH